MSVLAVKLDENLGRMHLQIPRDAGYDAEATEMRILVYKRTHQGDPDENGVFGVHECMGRVRAWSYDAVIGVGGIGAKPERHGIKGKVTWIGIGPEHGPLAGDAHPCITFKHFLQLDELPEFGRLAPKLSKRMYRRNVRCIMDSMTAAEHDEAERIVALAADAPPSPARSGRRGPSSPSRRCQRLSSKGQGPPPRKTGC